MDIDEDWDGMRWVFHWVKGSNKGVGNTLFLLPVCGKGEMV